MMPHNLEIWHQSRASSIRPHRRLPLRHFKGSRESYQEQSLSIVSLLSVLFKEKRYL